MTTDIYVAEKVKQALEATDGNKHDAQKLVITWAVKDPVLLLGLTKPHLKAIVTAHIDYALTPQKPSNDTTPEQTQFTPSDAQSILSAPPALTPEKRPNIPPPKSSIRQATIMQELVNAYKKNRE